MAIIPTNYNIFQIPCGEELSIGLEDMKLLIQQQHGQRFNVPFTIQFSEIRSEGQAIVDMQIKRSMNQWKIIMINSLTVCDNSSTTG
jgi:hypothetical protein